MIEQIKTIDIEDEIGRIERVNNSLFFLAGALPTYPHGGGMEELGTILECMYDRTKKALNKINQVAGLE